MSLGQREFGNIFTKEIKKEMSNKHIEIGRSGDNKITIKEYLITGAGVQPLTPITYDDVKIKIVGGRCLVMHVWYVLAFPPSQHFTLHNHNSQLTTHNRSHT